MSTLYDITSEQLEYLGARQLHAGDDYPHPFSAERPEDTALDLTGALIWLTIKHKSTDVDSDAVLQYSSTEVSEIEVTDALNGLFTVHFSGSDKEDLEGTWFYDIKVKLASGELVRLARGVIEFLPNITRASS